MSALAAEAASSRSLVYADDPHDLEARPALRATSRALGLGSAFCVAYVVVRARVEGDLAFVFLLWNLLLAWVPWRCALAASRNSGWRRGVWLAAWLAFLPNSYYVVTDLRHVTHSPEAINWVDLMAVVSCAWTSAMFGFGSVVVVQDRIARARGAVWGWLAALSALALSGFGVYLGRFRRWNSWDALLDPFALLADVWAQLRHPFRHAVGTSFSITFAGFVITTYVAIVAIARLRADLSVERGG